MIRPATKFAGLTITAILTLSFTASSSANCTYKPGPTDAEIATAGNNNAGISSAWYGNATDLYAHGVLGDATEARTLYAAIKDSDLCASEFTLNDQSVFEDVTPRIADVTGDGLNNVIVIESHVNKGASLAIYDLTTSGLKKIASTPYIGKPYRWLAPAGIADFNSDGINDVAYVQTPHIGGILKIWSFKNEVPALLAQAAGFSNHQIGDNFITGGLKTCGTTPILILPNQQWSQLLSAVMTGNKITTRVVSQDTRPGTVTQNLNCP